MKIDLTLDMSADEILASLIRTQTLFDYLEAQKEVTTE